MITSCPLGFSKADLPSPVLCALNEKLMKKLLCIALSIWLTASFSCQKKDEPVPISETVTDFDGNTYKNVKIGNQIWMAENLRTTHTPAGVAIVSFAPNSNEANVAEYGRLYTYADAVAATPTGWHIPTKADFEILINSLGGVAVAGTKLKDASFFAPADPTNTSINESGFSAKGAGYKVGTSIFAFRTYTGYWSEEKTVGATSITYTLGSDRNNIVEESYGHQIGFSVRYIKD
jgi:uncharacterized protein (TIGR02145 family)